MKAHEIVKKIDQALGSLFKDFEFRAYAQNLVGDDTVGIDFFQTPKGSSNLDRWNSPVYLKLSIMPGAGHKWPKGEDAPESVDVFPARQTGVKVRRKNKTTVDKAVKYVIDQFKKNKAVLVGTKAASYDGDPTDQLADELIRFAATLPAGDERSKILAQVRQYRVASQQAQPVPDRLVRVASNLDTGRPRLAVLLAANVCSDAIRMAKVDTSVLKKLQVLVSEWDAAAEQAIRDVIHIDDAKDKKDTAQTLFNMLKLQVADGKKQMDGLKRQHKLARAMNPKEQESAQSHIKRYKGRRGPGGYKFGEKFKHQGKDWLVYDFDAEGSGFTLTLVSPDFKQIIQGVADPKAKKQAADTTFKEWEEALRNDQEMLKKYEGYVRTLQRGGKVENLSLENAKRTVDGLKAVIKNKQKLIKGLKTAAEFDLLKYLQELPEPTPEEKREMAIAAALEWGSSLVMSDLAKGGFAKLLESNLGGKWPSKKPIKDGVKERASTAVIRDGHPGWKSLKRQGINSPRDMPSDTPVRVFFDTEYRKDRNGIVSRWTTGYGYTRADGRDVYLKKDDMVSSRFAHEGLIKFLKKVHADARKVEYKQASIRIAKAWQKHQEFGRRT